MYIILKLLNNFKILNIKINIFSIINYLIEDCFLMKRTIASKDNPITDTIELTYHDLIKEEQKKEKYLKKNDKKNIPIIKHNSCENLKELEEYNRKIINISVKIIELTENDEVEYCDEKGFLGQYAFFRSSV